MECACGSSADQTCLFTPVLHDFRHFCVDRTGLVNRGWSTNKRRKNEFIYLEKKTLKSSDFGLEENIYLLSEITVWLHIIPFIFGYRRSVRHVCSGLQFAPVSKKHPETSQWPHSGDQGETDVQAQADAESREFYLYLCSFTGDSVLSHLEWQSETPALHLQPGEKQPGRVAAHLQDLRAAGGRGGADFPAAHGHSGGNVRGKTLTQETWPCEARSTPPSERRA